MRCVNCLALSQYNDAINLYHHYGLFVSKYFISKIISQEIPVIKRQLHFYTPTPKISLSPETHVYGTLAFDKSDIPKLCFEIVASIYIPTGNI